MDTDKKPDYIQSAIDHSKMAFVEVYSRNRERMNMRDSLAKLYDEHILPLQSCIAELESRLNKANEYLEREGKDIRF